MIPALRDLLTPLTPLPGKAECYAGDTYVQETVAQLDAAGLDAAKFACEHSMLLLKPDAIVARAVRPTLDWLRHNDFRVVGAHTLAVNRHLVRALWYYAWNIASPSGVASPICSSASPMPSCWWSADRWANSRHRCA